MGNFPNNPLCQFNEGNDQMNGLEEDQPVGRAVHRCSPKPAGHLPYHNIYCPICMGHCVLMGRKSHFHSFLLVLYFLW